MLQQSEDKTKLWNEIIESEKKRTSLLPGEKTKRMLMEEYKMTFHEADVFIRRLRESGKITSRKTVVNGKICVAYSISDEE